MNYPVEHFFEKIEDEARRMRLLVNTHSNEYMHLLAFLRNLGRPADTSGTYASIGFKDGAVPGIIVQFHLSADESFMCAEPVVSWFLSCGWKLNEQSEDTSWGYRQIVFKKVVNGLDALQATVRIWPHPQSQVCKKVEDGTEPKYKFVCLETS